MIRSLLLAIFVASSVAASGQVFTIIGKERGKTYVVDVPAGKVLQILGFYGGANYRSHDAGGSINGLYVSQHKDADGKAIHFTSLTEIPSIIDGQIFSSHKVVVDYIAGPAVLEMYAVDVYMPILTYKLTDNIASSTSKPASPKADDIKLTDEFLMLDYTVQANTTYKLGISKDLKTWKPLFEFTPESDKLNVELPKIILGNESYLKLE